MNTMEKSNAPFLGQNVRSEVFCGNNDKISWNMQQFVFLWQADINKKAKRNFLSLTLFMLQQLINQ